VTTDEELRQVRRDKEQALEDNDISALVNLRAREQELLTRRSEEFKPNRRGA
jgi:hypothetical protein